MGRDRERNRCEKFVVAWKFLNFNLQKVNISRPKATSINVRAPRAEDNQRQLLKHFSPEISPRATVQQIRGRHVDAQNLSGT